ncbi:unnamed protein product [Danaus chrysippus]|uniref:(African queen) hypothetical protein n=1 Tax=Danaus chrysippus TaxID=151541 RepID=A0A8J2VV50_9NEOP|nr:unnamed protein product [Danaus chrysippus]
MCICVFCFFESAQFGDHKQDFGYVTVREGAHMFYWMYYTTANVANHTERPLIVWLQGGPGGSSTGIGNFEILGPLDENLQERNYTWVNNFNVIFVDNPVGTGFSYVDDPIYLTTTNDQIALDFVELMKGFYRSNPEFEEVPLYIYGQSYGGKMAIDMGVRMREAEIAGTIRSNLRGIAMGNAWISPVDSTLTWGPLLLAAGLVDEAGYELIQKTAREAERLFNEGSYFSSSLQWSATQRAVNQATTSVDFYNILTKTPVPQTFDNEIEKLILPDGFYGTSRRSRNTLNTLMNTRVKEALRIPTNVTWSASSNRVFNALRTDFMKPVTESKLKGENIGNVSYTAAFTRVRGKGDVFWWFYPTLAESPTKRPLLLWFHGVTGLPPSFLANFGMFGPYDVHLNKRNDSLVNDYNLLFVDGSIGTGFSTAESEDRDLPGLDEHVDILWSMLQSFYDVHNEYRESPIYLCSMGDGSQLVIPLVTKLAKEDNVSDQVKGIILGNPVISPALALTKLGYYLEELAYIDGKGRIEIESFSNLTYSLVQSESFEQAFDQFSSLDNFVNENAGAVSVNLNYIVEKLRRESNRDYFGQNNYVNRILALSQNASVFMETVVRPALGISNEIRYDGQREKAIQAFKSSYMKPIVHGVEHILNETNVNITIYNGNMDAVSNTPGQWEWIRTLKWQGQEGFLNQTRRPLALNGLLEGHSKISDRLRFYWINVAGLMVPLENPVAFKSLLQYATS